MQEELEKKVLQLLEINPDGLDINQIAQQLKVNRNSISKCLKTLEFKDKIILRKIDDYGLYYKV